MKPSSLCLIFRYLVALLGCAVLSACGGVNSESSTADIQGGGTDPMTLPVTEPITEETVEDTTEVDTAPVEAIYSWSNPIRYAKSTAADCDFEDVAVGSTDFGSAFNAAFTVKYQMYEIIGRGHRERHCGEVGRPSIWIIFMSE